MSEYRAGYGQAKADALSAINEAMDSIAAEMRHYKPTNEQTKELRTKTLALRWTRALLKSLKSPR